MTSTSCYSAGKTQCSCLKTRTVWLKNTVKRLKYNEDKTVQRRNVTNFFVKILERECSFPVSSGMRLALTGLLSFSNKQMVTSVDQFVFVQMPMTLERLSTNLTGKRPFT